MIRITTVNRGPGHDAAPFIPRFIVRLNQVHPRAIAYRLVGDVLHCNVRDRASLRSFDRNMMRYIGRNQGGGVIAPNGVANDPPEGDRIILVRVVARTQEFLDSYALGTVDLVDLLNSPPFSFQMNVLHMLEERFQTPDYQRRRQVFRRAHRQAIQQEVEYLRRLLNDNALRFDMEFARAPSVYVFRFRGDNGLFVEHVFTTPGGTGVGVRTESDVFVIRGRERQRLRQVLGRP